MAALLTPTRFQVALSDIANGAAGGSPERDAALAILRDPDHVVVVLANRAGSPAWSSSRFVVGRGDAGVVAQADAAERADQLDLALLPSAALAAVAIDDIVGITELGAISGPPLELGLPGYAAVLACADALQAATLRSRLERQPLAAFAVAAELLETQLAQGLAGADTRWAVTAARPISPGELGGVAGTLSAGLDELRGAGLVSGGTLTSSGVVLCTSFGSLVTTAQLTLVQARDGGPLLAPLGIFRSVGAIWLATWSGLAGAAPRVTLTPATPAAALATIVRLVGPIDGGASAAPVTKSARPKFCGSCGSPLPPTIAFCGQCGTKVPA